MRSGLEELEVFHSGLRWWRWIEVSFLCISEAEKDEGVVYGY